MKTYLFDFDGTLVDSMPAYTTMLKGILDDNNISYGEDLIRTITPLGTLGTANYLRDELGLNMSVEEIIRKMGERAIEEYTYNVPAKDNVIRVLRELKQQGAGLNILTASPHVTLDPCLKRLGIFELFDNVWSCDDFGTTKADADIYIRAAKLMGEKPENILFLDDNYNADKTAKLAGMKVCGVYDDSSKDFEEEMRLLCDYYIKDFSELLVTDSIER